MIRPENCVPFTAHDVDFVSAELAIEEETLTSMSADDVKVILSLENSETGVMVDLAMSTKDAHEMLAAVRKVLVRLMETS